MKRFWAFLKKEFLETLRSGKLLILGILFSAIGIMNPAIAKLTPWFMEIFAEEFAESGIIITEIAIDALTSWTQFFKNIPIALIVFVFMFSNSFTQEYESQTLVLVLTKGLHRYKVILAKLLNMQIIWAFGYALCFLITYAYNAYFWDNSIAIGLIPPTINWWIFGAFTISLMVLFSVLSRKYSGVLLGTSAVLLASFVLGLLPKAAKYMPTSLMNSAALLIGQETWSDYTATIIVTAVLSVIGIIASIPVFNKKTL